MSRLSLTLAAVGASLIALPAMAALPPYYDRVEQIQTILGSDEVASRLEGRPIDSLDYEHQEKDGRLKWEIDTDGCDINVWLEAEPMPEGMVGKVTYKVVTPIEACDR